MEKSKHSQRILKLLSIQFLLVITSYSAYAQQHVVNFGSLNQTTMCGDGHLDDSGNSIVLMHNDESGFMIGSFNSYFYTNWIISFGVGSGSFGKIIRLTNGDFFGYILQDTSGKGHVFKFNSSGTIYWHKELNNISPIRECLELSNQNIAIIARYGVTPVVVVFDSNGVVQFSKTISDGHSGNVVLRDLIFTNDNQHLLIGDCFDPSHPRRLFLIKTDFNFNPIWSKSFEYNGIDNYVRNSTQDLSNNYFLVGGSRDAIDMSNNDYDLSVLKFDSAGNYLVGKSFGSQYRDEAQDIERGNLTNNNLTIIGNSKPIEVCGDNLLVVSINSELDTIYTKHYGHPSGSGAYYSELHSINDSLYTFGSFSLWSNIGSSDGHLIKTNNSFEIDCEFYKNGLEFTSNLQLVEIVNPFVFSNTSISVLDYQTTSSAVITVKDACTGTILENEENDLSDIEMFPNPVNSFLNLKSENNIDLIVIYDILGKIVLESKNVNTKFAQINVSHLKKGPYMIEIEVNSKISRKKLIIN